MGDWQMTAIAAVSERVTVGFVGSQAPYFVEDGVPLLRGQNLRPFELDLSNLKYVSVTTHRKWKKSSLIAGDVAIVRVGYPGTAVVIPPGLGDLNAASLIIVRPDQARLDSHFLSYVLNSPWGKSQVAARLVGSAQQVLNTGAVADLRIPLPPLDGQRKIVEVLGSVDAQTRNVRRRVEVLEQMARAIYREWFVKFRYPGHEDVPLVDSALGPIPKGWNVRQLGEVVACDRTAVHPAKHEAEIFDHYSLPAFDQARLPSVESGGAIKSSKFLVSAPAVLLSKLNPRTDRTWLIEPGVERRAIASTEFLVLRPTIHWSLDSLYLLLTSQPFRDRLVSLSGGTSTSHQRTKPQDILATEIIDAPEQLSQAFAASVAPMLADARLLRVHAARLADLREMLLPKLVTGQIDVSTLDLDELVSTGSTSGVEVRSTP